MGAGELVEGCGGVRVGSAHTATGPYHVFNRYTLPCKVLTYNAILTRYINIIILFKSIL